MSCVVISGPSFVSRTFTTNSSICIEVNLLFLTSLSERIIEKSFYLSVWKIEQFSNTEKLKEKVERLNKLEEGTLGKEIANCLKENNLNLVPNYESHDLKHSLLNQKFHN